jgi:hypothetical protein
MPQSTNPKVNAPIIARMAIVSMSGLRGNVAGLPCFLDAAETVAVPPVAAAAGRRGRCVQEAPSPVWLTAVLLQPSGARRGANVATGVGAAVSRQCPMVHGGRLAFSCGNARWSLSVSTACASKEANRHNDVGGGNESTISHGRDQTSEPRRAHIGRHHS